MEVTEIAEAEEAEFHDPFDLPHVPFKFTRLSHQESIKRSKEFYELVNARRSLRMFSEDPVPIEVIRNCCMAAATAPSGAHTEVRKSSAFFFLIPNAWTLISPYSLILSVLSD
ncbi:hypothetical protein BDR26DRAFT_871501 [Obelidium mucronatum]|nr:hypothetical protein BDR26DRAFT_871501 [Obelidium mucronatum]